MIKVLDCRVSRVVYVTPVKLSQDFTGVSDFAVCNVQTGLDTMIKLYMHVLSSLLLKSHSHMLHFLSLPAHMQYP